MLEKQNIIRVEVVKMDGSVLINAEKNFSFPVIFDGDVKYENVLMIKGTKLPEMDKGGLVYIITHMRNGDRIRYLTQVAVSSEFQFNAMLMESRSEILEERRQYFKINAELTCKVNRISHGNDVKTLKSPILSKTKDINIGGIFLTTESDFVFQRGDTLLLSIDIEGECVETAVKVLRVQKNADKEVTGYGCQFINASKNQEEKVAQFINKVQLEMRRREKEKDF